LALSELPHGKARSLLKLLLLHRQRPISRTRLCALFWPDAEPESARNNLNVTLHRLRRALGSAAGVRHSEEGYQFFAAGEVWVDVEQFRLHAEMAALEDAAGRPANAIGQYEAALALHRSELIDEGEHEAALAADAQSLRDLLNQVLERLAVLREDAGDLHGCVRVSLRHLGLDECNEGAHRRLMRCYAGLGQPQLADRQFRRCVASLRQLLAMPPADETTLLYRRITERKAA
jgi:DNA-binding SARP family transcriptional activator